MKLNRVDHTPLAHRVGRYHFQMAQARLNTPVEPVSTYSLQPFYARQQEWLTELSHSLSRLYRFTADLDQAARQFAVPRSAQLSIGPGLPQENEMTAASPAQTDELLQKTNLLVERYNRLRAFLDEHEDVLSTQKLDTFERITRAAEGPLQRFGLRLRSDGQLELHESEWRSAVQSDSAGFVGIMKGLGRQFREELLKLQKSPFGSFSRTYDDVRSAHPYRALSMPSLRYQYAAAAGVYLDIRW
jgi:hypothetical protein